MERSYLLSAFNQYRLILITIDCIKPTIPKSQMRLYNGLPWHFIENNESDTEAWGERRRTYSSHCVTLFSHAAPSTCSVDFWGDILPSVSQSCLKVYIAFLLSVTLMVLGYIMKQIHMGDVSKQRRRLDYKPQEKKLSDPWNHFNKVKKKLNLFLL